MQIPEFLKSTYTMLSETCPNGICEEDYWIILYLFMIICRMKTKLKEEADMNWHHCTGKIITNEMVNNVQDILGVVFPEDFLFAIKKYDGGYPSPNKITIDNSIEVVNNLVSFMEDDLSYIIDVFYEAEYLEEIKLIPIAEDPFENLYCYDFGFGKNEIVFWNHENPDDKRFICDSFTKFIQMLHD